MKPVTGYYAPTCAFSIGTISFMLLRGADRQLVNLDEHDDLREELERRLAGKKLETPTVEHGGELLVAPPLFDLKKRLLQWGLPDEASPHAQLSS